MRVRMILVIVAGLALGFCLREGWHYYHVTSKSRASMMLETFKDYCLPFSQGKLVAPKRDWAPFLSLPDQTWVRLDEEITLSLSVRQCAVADVATHLSAKDRAFLKNEISELIAKEKPTFKVDTNHGITNSDEFFAELWAIGRAFRSDRQAISYSRFAPSGDHSKTEIGFRSATPLFEQTDIRDLGFWTTFRAARRTIAP